MLGRDCEIHVGRGEGVCLVHSCVPDAENSAWYKVGAKYIVAEQVKVSGGNACLKHHS